MASFSAFDGRAARRPRGRDAPVLLGVRARASRSRRSAGPRSTTGLPGRALGRREQRLGRGVEVQVAAEVDEQQAVARRPRRRSAARTPLRPSTAPSTPPRPLRAEDRILAAQPQQVAVQVRRSRRAARARENRACSARRCRGSPGSGRQAAHLGLARLRNCARNSTRPLRDQLGAARGCGRRRRGTGVEAANSWPWKSIGVPGASSSSAVIARSRPGLVELVEPLAAAGVGDLVVVLDEGDECAPAAARRPGVPRRLLLPLVALALVEVAVLDRRDELLRRAEVVGVVGLVVAGQRDHGAVVEVVVPERVEAIAALLGRAGPAACPAARSRPR